MEVWYINLDRRTDRRDALEKNLKEMNVPNKQIRRVSATDRDAFESPDALVAHAAEIGFPEFQESLRHGIGLKYLGYNISYFRALDEIRNQNKIVLLMEDDYILTESYYKIWNSFLILPLPLKFAMLGYGWHTKNQTFSEFRPCAAVSDESVWQYGAPQRGTCANIFTPDGAAYLLDICKTLPTKSIETVIRDVIPTFPGIYSRKPAHIAIEESPAVGESDVDNESGCIFESKHHRTNAIC